ncbi:SDR family oxidoreductase [Brumimicrobium aurantiacum]|uniref:SDR family NAD(P)-dependent oxidoreductase n=1 Tax=Brumimicrobium aurantiacum TaxID=1737063 RepID=A0A3E1EWB1_9FLAO|nr:SDR family oxidoreductase [Brumimicrobium aurantiacum]RFC53846.1 SDR family NAD(P)-dependent oxidoreductase [Brumimicrobium aurantiacum]
MDLKDKVILITGGNSGLGKATAIACIEKGAKVIITGRDHEKTETVAKEIGAVPFKCDVTKDEEIDALYKYIKTEIGELDVLVNNAGIGLRNELVDLTREELRKVYEVNVFGAAMVAQGAAKIFVDQNYGDIINIASTASLKGYPTGSIYSSSKFALRGMTQAWQGELRKNNIRVIQVNPSEVPTAFGDEENREERPLESNKLTPSDIAETIINTLQMDRRAYIPEVTVHATNPF